MTKHSGGKDSKKKGRRFKIGLFIKLKGMRDIVIGCMTQNMGEVQLLKGRGGGE